MASILRNGAALAPAGPAMTSTRPTSTGSLLAYAALNTPLQMLMMQLIVYLPPFYASEIGLPLAEVGFVFFLARAWDAVIDPWIGNLSDRTRSRFGRRKPWVAIGVPALMVGTWAFAQPPSGIGVPYLLVTAFLFYIALAAVQIPYMSWGAELSRDYAGRTRVGAFREGALMVGILLATSLPLLVLGADPSVREILRVFVLTTMVLLPVTTLAALYFTPVAPFVDSGRHGLLAALSLLRRNRPLLRLLSGIFVFWLGGAMFNAMILFLVSHRLGLSTSSFLWFVFLQYLVSIACLPLSAALGNRIGRHRALVAGAMAFFAILPLFMLVPKGEFGPALAVFLAAGAVTNVIWLMPPALVADTVEYGMFRGIGDDSALYMALYMFVQKLALAVGVGLALPLAAALGFDLAAPGSAASLRALDWVGLILPGVVALGGAAILWNYPITAARHATLRKWLARRAARTAA
jgi:GPH family glycoside/pentoside/hexuronide:cation symporter